MKVTIYELLGMIKNGKTPKKIKCFNYNFIYTGDKRPQRFYKLVNQDNYLLKDFVYNLNTKVEIIEEPQEHKIPEKIKMRVYSVGDINNKIENLNLNQMIIEDKINEILDYLSKEE